MFVKWRSYVNSHEKTQKPPKSFALFVSFRGYFPITPPPAGEGQGVGVISPRSGLRNRSPALWSGTDAC